MPLSLAPEDAHIETAPSAPPATLVVPAVPPEVELLSSSAPTAASTDAPPAAAPAAPDTPPAEAATVAASKPDAADSAPAATTEAAAPMPSKSAGSPETPVVPETSTAAAPVVAPEPQAVVAVLKQPEEPALKQPVNGKFTIARTAVVAKSETGEKHDEAEGPMSAQIDGKWQIDRSKFEEAKKRALAKQQNQLRRKSDKPPMNDGAPALPENVSDEVLKRLAELESRTEAASKLRAGTNVAESVSKSEIAELKAFIEKELAEVRKEYIALATANAHKLRELLESQQALQSRVQTLEEAPKPDATLTAQIQELRQRLATLETNGPGELTNEVHGAVDRMGQLEGAIGDLRNNIVKIQQMLPDDRIRSVAKEAALQTLIEHEDALRGFIQSEIPNARNIIDQLAVNAFTSPAVAAQMRKEMEVILHDLELTLTMVGGNPAAIVEGMTATPAQVAAPQQAAPQPMAQPQFVPNNVIPFPAQPAYAQPAPMPANAPIPNNVIPFPAQQIPQPASQTAVAPVAPLMPQAAQWPPPPSAEPPVPVAPPVSQVAVQWPPPPPPSEAPAASDPIDNLLQFPSQQPSAPPQQLPKAA